MPCYLARGEKAGDRSSFPHHASASVCCNATERVSDGADQRIGQERGRTDGARPIRLRWLERLCCREPVTARRVETIRITQTGRVVGRDRISKNTGIYPD